MSSRDFWSEALSRDSDLEELEVAFEEIPMVPVESSNLAMIGYYRRRLQVAFVDGRVYQYRGVPRAVYDALAEAASKGSYFYWNIRTQYDYQEIG